jgi:hypothetical protein
MGNRRILFPLESEIDRDELLKLRIGSADRPACGKCVQIVGTPIRVETRRERAPERDAANKRQIIPA